MTIVRIFISFLLLYAGTALALSKSDVRAIIEQEFPDSRVTEIDKERFNNKKVYEVDFLHQGKKLEAIIDLDGSIIKVDVDD
jgi:uncharacterized membrane protein YkoI